METPRKLPTTSHAVLGMLSFGETSGYDLLKFVETSIGLFWTPAKSQVYAELRRLVEHGYATEREVEQTDRPDKRLYKITPAGERALGDWLADTDVEYESTRSPFLLKLFFGHRAGRETVSAQVRAARERAVAFVTELRAIEEHIKGVPEMAYPYLTLRFGLAHAQATIDWCDQTLGHLGKGGKR